MPKCKTITDGRERMHASERAAYEAIQQYAAVDPTGHTTVYVRLLPFDGWQLFERVNHADLQPTGK